MQWNFSRPIGLAQNSAGKKGRVLNLQITIPATATGLPGSIGYSPMDVRDSETCPPDHST
jgi:hypothetical protein